LFKISHHDKRFLKCTYLKKKFQNLKRWLLLFRGTNFLLGLAGAGAENRSVSRWWHIQLSDAAVGPLGG
jgi:hypothetical protein